MAEDKAARAARNRRYYEKRMGYAPEPAPEAAATPRPRLKIHPSLVAASRRKPSEKADGQPYNPFKPYEACPGVKGTAGLAMDAADWGQGSNTPLGWAQQSMSNSAYADGMEFLGYPALSAMAQRPEYRVISETISEEMTRRWIKFVATGDDDKTDKIELIEEGFRKLMVRDRFKEIAEHDGFFGRSHLYIDTGDGNDPEELKTDIGNGRSSVSRQKVGLGRLQGLRVIEPVWTYPTHYESNDPLSDRWYRPDSWLVMGKTVHASRLLTFIGREVPDLLKPAYSFGGVPLSQMAKPYVDNWLRVRKGTTDAIVAFSVFVLSTDMTSALSPDNEELLNRAQLFNTFRNNQNLLILDKEQELFQNISMPISGLEGLQAQAQEHMAAVCKIPLVKLLGISPSGLNASSEGELRCFNDSIHAYQERFYRPNLERVLGFVQLSLFGEVDPEIDFEFEHLYEPTDTERAQVRKTDAETGQTLIDGGVISPQEERVRIAADDDSPYAGLDVDDMPEPPQPEMPPGMPPGMPGMPGAKPPGAPPAGGAGAAGAPPGGAPKPPGAPKAFGGPTQAPKAATPPQAAAKPSAKPPGAN